MKYPAFIFARGGSKGLPRKNVRLFNGRPLICYSIQTALKCPSIECVYVSTDDEEIAEVAGKEGAEVIVLAQGVMFGHQSGDPLLEARD